MNNIDLRTPRQIKAEETKNKILEAAHTLIQNHELSYLTVKNVCALAEVSNGKFFHFYKSKNDLIIAYMHNGYSNYIEENPFQLEEGQFIDNIVGLYLHNIAYCKEIGLEFISHYYTINNKSLLSYNPKKDATTALMSTALDQLNQAIDTNVFSKETDPYEVLSDLGMIVKGIIMEWAISEGHLMVEAKISKLCRIYLESL